MTLANLPRPNETTAGPDSPQSQIQAQIQAFAQRFGDAHLRLAYHAAFPLSLTPDLLYRLWGSVQDEGLGESETIPWVAVSDVLLVSGFCDCVGHDLYELDPDIRAELLRQLEADPRYGPGRMRELAEFVLAEAEALSHSPDKMQRDYAQVQRWGALAYVQPGQAAKELANGLGHAYRDDEANLNRMATVVIHLADPLKDYPALIAYARGMARYARGDEAGAASYLQQLGSASAGSTVEGVEMPLPQIEMTPASVDDSSARFKWRLAQITLGLLGTAALLGGGYWFSVSQTEPPPDEENTPATIETTLDLSELESAFAESNWREADDETWNLLLEAADEDESGWLSEREIEGMSCGDLRAIDQQWLAASDGRFGFSVQARIWQEVGSPTEYNEQWEEFGDRVGWRESGQWIGYDSVSFDTEQAPIAHLPFWRDLTTTAHLPFSVTEVLPGRVERTPHGWLAGLGLVLLSRCDL